MLIRDRDIQDLVVERAALESLSRVQDMLVRTGVASSSQLAGGGAARVAAGGFYDEDGAWTSYLKCGDPVTSTKPLAP